MSFDLDEGKSFRYWMDQMGDLARALIREHGVEYLTSHELTHRLCGEYMAQGFSYEISYVLSAVVFRKFYDTLASESKNPESEFIKLPMEWQWDICAELNDVEMEKALKAAKIVEDEFLKIEMGIGE